MATFGDQISLSFGQYIPGALRNAAFRFARFADYDPVNSRLLVDVSSGGGTQQSVVGIFKNNVHDLSAGAGIIVLGEAKIAVGAAVDAHAMLTSDGEGRAVMANSGDYTGAMSMEAATQPGEVIRCLAHFPAVRITY